MNKFKITGGVLPLFRIFMVIRLIWSVFMLLTTIGRSNVLLFEWPTMIGIGECLLLLGYLYCPGLEKRLGRFYLPLALIVTTLGPWVENMLALSVFPTFIQQFKVLTGTNKTIIYSLLFMVTQIQLAFVLFTPLILISWQYKLKWVLIYSAGISVMSIAQFLYAVYNMQAIQGPVPGVFGAAFALASLFLFIGFVVNRLAYDQKERNRQLSQYALTLEHLTTSRERNRLAREIHDTLAHTLSGLAVNLEAVNALWQNDPPQAKQILQHSLLVTRNGLVETRRAIQALRAGPLEDLGLSLALKQMAISSAERYALQTELDLPENPVNLEPSVEQAVYRIAEEAVRNICQHAKASRFFMGLKTDEGRLTLTLTDDGKGFDTLSENKDNHFGLRGMQERAEAIGGVLSIISDPRHGTSLKFVVEGLQK